jgi:hypothetical protein
MSPKDTVFYKGKQAVNIDFNASEISSDGALLLVEKIERNDNIIKYFSNCIPDNRHQSYIKHDVYKLLKQRVMLMMQGYADANDATHLKNDPVINQCVGGILGSQPTISRFENSVDKHVIFNLLHAWLDRYIRGLGNRKRVIIDIDGTDAETHGHQQLSLFNGFYGHTMYNELLFHDGETGEIILPALRPGNSHSNWWYVAILKRIVHKIRAQYPEMEIIIRADSGFSTPKFYEFASKEGLKYTIGIPCNNVLKNKALRAEKAVRKLYLANQEKHQHFIGPFHYQAGTWKQVEQCFCKVESTGKGMNTRYIISNFEEQSSREIYLNFYVKRGESSENRIKELKNMCFSDRLSDHNFWANFFRLIISSIVYEIYRIIKEMIKKTGFEKAKKWMIDNIRLYLMKAGSILKVTKRRIQISFTKSYICKDLFSELIRQ